MSLITLVYIVLTTVHFITQFLLSIYYRLSYRKGLKRPSKSHAIAILIPGYHEDLDAIYKTIEDTKTALKCAAHADLTQSKIIYVEDDAPNDIYQQLCEWYERDPLVAIVSNGSNLGKRKAQHTGYKIYRQEYPVPDYVLTVDSDTSLHPRSIDSLICNFNGRKIGAVTGNITILHKKNILQQLISLRYYLAFNQERASQSVFGQVLCCSGPLTLYRGDLMEDLFDRYTSQHFRGVECTFGDDRHLTNLILESGFKTRYDYRAVAYTSCPDTLRKYLKQQYRWSKSFFREGLYSLNNVLVGRFGVRYYAIWEVLIGFVLPLLLLANFAEMTFDFHRDALLPIRYAIVVLAVAYIRALFGLATDNLNNKGWYITFPAYALINILLLIPIRIRALFTINDNRWGTR